MKGVSGGDPVETQDIRDREGTNFFSGFKCNWEATLLNLERQWKVCKALTSPASIISLSDQPRLHHLSEIHPQISNL